MRILVADSQSNVRFALRVLLGQQPELEIVGEAVDAGALMSQTKTARPDLVLLHWRLQGLAAAELLAALRRICPSLRVVVLSAQPEARAAALAAGADDFVSKMDPPDRLLAAIQSVRHAEDEEPSPRRGRSGEGKSPPDARGKRQQRSRVGRKVAPAAVVSGGE
jgi:DNA-binding NarL/FixJ family response regulator